MAKHIITGKEWILALVFAVAGFFAYLKSFLVFYNSLNPFFGLILYYIIVYTSLYFLAHFELIMFRKSRLNPIQLIGATMITFAFFIIFNWTNPYIQIVLGRSVDAVSNIFYACEDGATWYLWSLLIPTKTQANIFILRILTFMITPFLLVLGGSYLISKKPNLG